jgi:prepilin-type N-terminal cleavage/methylation domain-containing protein
MSCHTRCGFTLLEMAVVLVIIAVVVGMSITSGVSVIATARQTATQQKMKAIDNALAAYGAANGRLPCPGDLTLAPGNTNYGLEAGAGSSSTIAAATGACTGTGMLPQANFTATGTTNSFATAAEGALPATTLGLPQDFMADGWGNKFRYAVDISMTTAGAFQNMPVGCVSGPITVNDANGNARTTGAIYALISHGANGHGAYTLSGATVSANSVNTNEQTNCHCNSSGTTTSPSVSYAPTYVQMNPYVDTNTSDTNYQFNTFDDIVSYKERWQLQTAWDKPGSACPYLYASGTDASGNPAIQVYNYETGAYVKAFGDSGASAINQPHGLTTDSSGNIWLIDPLAGSGKSLKEYNQSGTLLNEFGPACCGTPDNEFSNAYRLAVDSSGNVWVNDNGNNRVLKFSSTGSWLMTIGGASSDQCAGAYYNASSCSYLYGHTNCCAPNASSCSCTRGSSSGQFSNVNGYAVGIAIDSSGNVWVPDVDNNRVEEFNSTTGAYINSVGAGYNGVSGSIGSAGTTNGALTSPMDVHFDSSGNLWVISAGSGKGSVDEFNPTTYAWMQTAITAVSGTSADGAFYSTPSVSTFDPSGNLWIADSGNNRVQQFNIISGIWLKTLGGGSGCAGSYASSTACLTLSGFASCCSPSASSCSCASGNGNGLFPSGKPLGLAIVTSR